MHFVVIQILYLSSHALCHSYLRNDTIYYKVLYDSAVSLDSFPIGTVFLIQVTTMTIFILVVHLVVICCKR